MADDTSSPAVSSPFAPHKEFLGINSPLGLIGAFTLLVEVALIGATIVVDDASFRWGLLAFAIVAFFSVSGCSFWFLHNRPEVLYSPGQFRGGTSAEEFTRAMARDRATATKEIATRTATIDAEIVTIPIDDDDSRDADFESLGDSVSTKAIPEKSGPVMSFEEYTGAKYLTLFTNEHSRQMPFLDIKAFFGKGERTRNIPYDPDMWVGTFIVTMSEEFKKIGFYSSPESYGLTWVVNDRNTGMILDDIGFIAKSDNIFNHGRIDRRTLSETPVYPGMILEPDYLPPPAPYPDPPKYVVNDPPDPPGTFPEESKIWVISRHQERSEQFQEE